MKIGSARIGTTKIVSNNKLNSFRGGPIRATMTAIDNSSISHMANTQNNKKLAENNEGIVYVHSQRPNSSKPTTKNS